MKRRIAIVAGGDSTEYEVSLKSAAGIKSFLDPELYESYVVLIHGLSWSVLLDDGGKADIDRNDFSFQKDGQKCLFDYAYITIHGTPGENGFLQGYFELIRMKYSTCGVLASALTYDKFATNQYLQHFGVSIAESLLIKKGQEINVDEIISTIPLPFFVKPSGGGSSFGVTKVKTPEAVIPAIEEAFTEADHIIVEAFMDGREFSCGCLKTPTLSICLPATEVITHNEFFDFNAKYNGQVEEITPANISEDLMKRMQGVTSAIYDILGAKGIIRVDYIVTAGDKINLLEVNTTPGMTATSFIPQQVRAAGLTMKEVMTAVIEASF